MSHMASSAGSALQSWITSFPQLSDQTVDDTSHEFVCKLLQVAAEIVNVNISPFDTVEGGYRHLSDLLDVPLEDDSADKNSSGVLSMLLSSLLCRALSPTCPHRTTYIERIMSMDDDTQRELMKIIQENGDEETGDYSTSVMEESEDELPDSTEVLERSLLEEIVESKDSQEQDDVTASIQDNHIQQIVSDEQIQQLKQTITQLQSQLTTSQTQEQSLQLQIDELTSSHKAEMIRLESSSLQTIRQLQDSHSTELTSLKRQHDHLMEADTKVSSLAEENKRLRDELDVLNFSSEKLSYTEEQLRKCKSKLEEIGDAKSALEQSEKSHAASVEKCIALEKELASLKPLKRQLEEYKLRATDAEVALTECRDDLRRLKEKSGNLEGVNEELKRGADKQFVELANQQRIMREGEELDHGGGVGVGLSELNPELMQELNMLRSEYDRLKEFETLREADNVQRMIESCDDAKRLSDRFKEQYINTKGQLEDTLQLLQQSRAQEARLREEVANWTERHRKLGEEMKEERIKSHKAALDMEREFHDTKKSLSEKARADMKELEDKLTTKLENERKQHKVALDRLHTERDDIESRFSKQLAELREQSSNNLRSTKEALQKRIDDLEQSKTDALETAEREKKIELEALTQKGKGMLRDKLRAIEASKKKSTDDSNAKIKALQDQLSKLEAFQIDFEEKAKNKIAQKKQQIQILQCENEQAIATNSDLEEKYKKAERTSKELVSENDRLRRQVGRGPGGASQTQLEELVSVCNSLRQENRRLKESFADTALPTEPSFPANENASSIGISKSALIEYRQEFEERIQSLEEDKRDLIMRNSAAMSDVIKAEARTWELAEELNKVKGELTTTKLAMQRNERRAELLMVGSNTKGRKRMSSGTAKENTTPNIHHRTKDFTPTAVESSSKKSKTDLPSLMDMAKGGAKAGDGEQSECKQS